MKQMNKRIWLLLGFAVLVCILLLSLKFMNNDQQAIVDIARKYVAEKRPEWVQELSRDAHVYERDGIWIVSFGPPKGSVGGGPVVEIEKKSLRVINHYHSQ
jgi:hypothetical protein